MDARTLNLIEGWPTEHGAAFVMGSAAEPHVVESYGDAVRPFALASLTKPLFAYAVLVAIEEGTLELDHPAGPEGSTVRHLLSHASGLGPEASDGSLSGPGVRRVYSNAGFERLAEVLEIAAGMGAIDYLVEAVWRPLGMTDTNLAGSVAHAATSTAADMARFVAELLSPTLISPATLREAVTPQFGDLGGVLPGFGRSERQTFGLGFEIRDTKSPHWTSPANSPATFGHFGRSGTFFWVDPMAQVALCALTTTDFGPWAAEAWPVLSSAVLDAFGVPTFGVPKVS